MIVEVEVFDPEREVVWTHYFSAGCSAGPPPPVMKDNLAFERMVEQIGVEVCDLDPADYAELFWTAVHHAYGIRASWKSRS